MMTNKLEDPVLYSFHLSKDLLKQLKEQMKKEEDFGSQIIRKAIRLYIANYERLQKM